MTAASVDLVALGVPLTVTGLPAPEADDFRALWRPCLTGAAREGSRIRLVQTQDGWRSEFEDRRWDLAGQDAVVAAAGAAVNAAATTRTGLLAAHAAVVTKNGLTAVVPGASGSGKSTLTLALLRIGWSYTSDEAFAVDRASGELCHYARPVTVGDWTCRTLGLTGRGRRSAGETYLTASDLGAALDLEPATPSLVILRTLGDDAVFLTQAHRMDGLEALLRRGFTTHVDPGEALHLMADVTRGCDVVRVSGGEPQVAAESIDALAG